jgi:hypothetical protein
MAYLNVTPWDPSAAAPAPASDPAAQESAQYDTLFTGAFSILDFIELGRISFEQAEGVAALEQRMLAGLSKQEAAALGTALSTCRANLSRLAEPSHGGAVPFAALPAGVIPPQAIQRCRSCRPVAA